MHQKLPYVMCLLHVFFQDLTKWNKLYFLGIPALQPIVHDLFVLRAAGKSDTGEDLETQREVVVSMLLRLVHFPEVGLSVSRTVSRPVVWLVSWSASQSVEQLFSQSVGRSFGR